jgi:hypothetical protein
MEIKEAPASCSKRNPISRKESVKSDSTAEPTIKESSTAESTEEPKNYGVESDDQSSTMKKENVPPTKKETSKFSVSRTVVLRVILISSLVTAAALCATVSYVSLRNTEQEVGRQTYESIAASALRGAKSTTQRKLQGSEVMATLVSFALPDSEMWPLITVDGYITIADNVAKLSSSGTQSLMVLVDPAQASEFEAHTQQVYMDQERPEGAGVNGFGFGIWKSDPDSPFTDSRTHDVSGEVSATLISSFYRPLSCVSLRSFSFLQNRQPGEVQGGFWPR